GRNLRVLEQALEVEQADELGRGDLVLVHHVFGPGLARAEQDRIALFVQHRHLLAHHLDLALDLEEGEVERVAERKHGERQYPDHRRQEENEADAASPAHRSTISGGAGPGAARAAPLAKGQPSYPIAAW